MKKRADKLTVKRTSTSPYFAPSFNRSEIESLSPYADMIAFDAPNSCDVLITNTHTNFDQLPKDFIDNLKLIIHPNSGYDNFPLDFIKELRAPIVLGNTIRAQAVTQYILSALFNHFSPIPHHPTWNSHRKWPRKLISDLKINLIGYGHIGKTLSRSLAPIVGELNIYDPYENFTQLNHRDSDIVILACGLNKKNRHLINKHFLNVIKEDALIINTARGELINTSDLVNFLTANEQAFAVLDVFENEPCDFSCFSSLKNIKLTSHIAGVFKEIDQHTINFEVEVLRDFTELSAFDFKNKYQKAILQNRIQNDIGII